MEKTHWQRAMETCTAAQREITLLGRSTEDVVPLVKQALARGDPNVFLLIPGVEAWRPGFTLQLADDLLDRALSDRYALQVCRILGGLPHADLERVIGPLVVKRLRDADGPYADLDFRRYAEVLRFLGLSADLRDLIDRARASTKLEVRNVGEEFSRKLDGGERPFASRLSSPTPRI